MIQTVRKSMLLLLLVTLLPATAAAQDELLDEQQAEIKLYSVEIIVFTYAGGGSPGNELFPPDEAEAEPDEPAPVAEIAVEPLLRRHPDYVGLVPVMLREDQFTLQKVVEQLERLDAYEPILHVGWTQPGYPPSDTVTMPVASFVAVPAGLDGNFTLYLSRYLHLVVNLVMTAPQVANSYEAMAGPVRFRLEEDRIVKNGEIRYFDHPKFGVVAKVLRVDSAIQ
jgi:hypothetical protein